MPSETGFPRSDVENDFIRARRRQVLTRLAYRLRREPDDVNLILPFDDVVSALGRRGERRLGLKTIKLASIVGTVDSRHDFDRHFRPTSSRVRERWERLALAQRRGESIPPVEVYRIGDLHFVIDGHHRVSIAIATGQKTIDAYVTEVLTRLAYRLRREPDDVNLILPFDDVVSALGRRGERRLGLKTIKLASIVGTVDSRRDFDRHFRPTSSRVRERWERLALAQRRGESIPPVEVYRIGDLHFVIDGHHRVSIAIATGQKTIDAYVTEVLTAVPASGIRGRADLVMKDGERLFRSRVPLPAQAVSKIIFADPWCYAELSEAVEAWGYRCMQAERAFIDREQMARRWWAEEYQPVLRMLRAADMIGTRTEAEAYLRVARERYRLMRTHEWSDEIIARLRREIS